jgi:endonuclease III
MKDSREYSQKLQKLYRSLKQQYPRPEKVEYDEPVDAIVHALITENLTEAQTQAAMKKFKDHFVDWNDLRVASAEEIVDTIGEDCPATRNTALAITSILGMIFEKNNAVTLEVLKKMGKRPAKQAMEKIPGTTPFVVDYCMLTSLQGHAIPLTKTMIEYLKVNRCVHPEADRETIEGYLTRQIAAKDAFEFYVMLRQESETQKPEKTGHGTEARKKTAKKAKT